MLLEEAIEAEVIGAVRAPFSDRQNLFTSSHETGSMEYSDSDRSKELAERTRAFVSDVVVDVERDLRTSTHLPDTTLSALHQEARDRGIFGPGIPEEYGGCGLSFRDQVPVLEAAGRSRIGPAAIHAPPWPDEAGLYALQVGGTDRQKERWLEPLAEAEIKSAFSMTEPTDGGGSDPGMIRTTAERDGDEWVIDGHKWWVTQGSDADVVFVFAKTDPSASLPDGITCFVVQADTPGVEVKRDIAHMSDHVAGEPVHSEIVFDSVRVPEENVLGGVDQAFRFFQQVVNHSRVWLGITKTGMAERALDVAKAYAKERNGFGGPLAEKQALRFEIANAETDLHSVRLMSRDVAKKMTEGEDHRTEVAMYKYRSANLVQDIVDTAVQECGANGIGEDLPLSDFYTNVRAYRIYDGPDAVHKLQIARRAFDDDDIDPREIDTISRFGAPNTEPRE